MRARASGSAPLRDRSAAPRGQGRSDLFALAVIALIPLAGASRALLPPRFSYDSEAIGRIAAGDYAPLEDTSYLYVGRLYGYLGLAERPWAAAVLGIAFAAVVLYPALVRVQGTPTLQGYALVGLYALTASVYLAQYSKDVWVVPVVLVVLVARPGLRGEVAVILAAAAYASLLRSYWFLILLIYLGLRLLTASRLSRARVLLGIAGTVAAMTLLAPVVLGADIQGVRDSINLDRVLSTDAATAISAPELGLGPVGDIVENLLTLGALALPVPLLTQGSPVYVVYFVAIVLIWGMFARSFFVGPERVLDGRRAREADGRTVRAGLFALAVLTTQGFFEPDYGSYLRHLTPVLPLVIAAVLGRPRSGFVAAPAPPPGDGPSLTAGAASPFRVAGESAEGSAPATLARRSELGTRG